MIATFGVPPQRGVREAVSALRSEGLVLNRQGVGAVRRGRRQKRPFRITQAEPRQIGGRGCLRVMELRTGVRSRPPGRRRAALGQAPWPRSRPNRHDRRRDERGEARSSGFRVHRQDRAADRQSAFRELLGYSATTSFRDERAIGSSAATSRPRLRQGAARARVTRPRSPRQAEAARAGARRTSQTAFRASTSASVATPLP